MSGRTLVDAIGKLRPELVQLATHLALVGRPDRDLVRLMRRERQPRSTIELELELWSSPIVSHRTARELTFATEALSELRRRLEEKPDLLSECWRLAVPWLKTRTPLQQCEDRLTYLGLLTAESARDQTFDSVALKAGSIDDEIEQRIGSVVSAMRANESRRNALAAWTARVMPVMPERVRARGWSRLLVAVAATRVPTDKALLDAMPQPEHVPLARELAASQPERDVWIRRVSGQGFGSLEISATSLPQAVPWKIASPTTVVVDDDRTYRIAPTGVTKVPLDREEPVLEASDGQRWLAAQPKVDTRQREILGVITGEVFGRTPRERSRIVYLVDEGYAITTWPEADRERELPKAAFPLDLVRGGPVTARIAGAQWHPSIVVLRLSNRTGRPVRLLPASVNSAVHVLSPFAEAPLLGTIESDPTQLTFAADVPEPGRWIGAPVFCHTDLIGHIATLTAHRATLCPAPLIKQWLESARADDPVVEILDPPWREHSTLQPLTRVGRMGGGRPRRRVGFFLEVSPGRKWNVGHASTLVVSELSEPEREASLFLRMGAHVCAARAVAFDPESQLAVLAPIRPVRVEGLKQGPVVDPYKVAGEDASVRVSGGRALPVKLAAGRAYDITAVPERIRGERSTLAVELQLETPEVEVEESERLTVEGVMALTEARERTERPPDGAPVMHQGKVVGLIALESGSDITRLRTTPLRLDHLVSTPGELRGEPYGVPRVWMYPHHDKSGILNLDGGIPGLAGIRTPAGRLDRVLGAQPFDLDGGIPGLAGIRTPAGRLDRVPGAQRFDLAIAIGPPPRAQVRGPLARKVRLRSLGEPVEVDAERSVDSVVLAPRMPGRSETWVLRRGLRIAAELTRQLQRSASGEARSVRNSDRRVAVFLESGLADIDVGVIADLAAFEWGEDCDVIEWFAERGVLELFVADDMTWSRMRSSKEGALGKLAYAFEATEPDSARGLYGWLWQFAGRTLTLRHVGAQRELEVRAEDGEPPVTGWVSFFLAPGAEPVRVRAESGVARVPLTRSGVVGALIEREGVELELSVGESEYP